ncbi:hypothetical protein [Muricomes sp. OA1]|uniref:hypothetical protein n=1 Tax=Muricomes sp. OA1 TaxID=2914165 RepID=UPI0023DD0A6D|nr:hypothetical protein [Muricomes sp. OA1]
MVEVGGKLEFPMSWNKAAPQSSEKPEPPTKTHITDYEEAVTEETKAFMKVHTATTGS